MDGYFNSSRANQQASETIILTSHDTKWTQLPRPEPVCYDGLYLDPFEGDYIYLTSQYHRVARSLDGGQTWQILDGRNNNGLFASSFAIDPYDPTRLYVGDGVYVSILLDNSSFTPATMH